MTKIKFYGNLKKFGSEFSLEVKDTAEAIRALCTQISGLREALRDGVYKVRIGKQYLDPSALEKGLFYCLERGKPFIYLLSKERKAVACLILF
ncbi:hypothetical protein OBFLKGFO_02384 [Mannheimia haemolytica]